GSTGHGTGARPKIDHLSRAVPHAVPRGARPGRPRRPVVLSLPPFEVDRRQTHPGASSRVSRLSWTVTSAPPVLDIWPIGPVYCRTSFALNVRRLGNRSGTMATGKQLILSRRAAKRPRKKRRRPEPRQYTVADLERARDRVAASERRIDNDPMSNSRRGRAGLNGHSVNCPSSSHSYARAASLSDALSDL